jgi:hypothetical protein
LGGAYGWRWQKIVDSCGWKRWQSGCSSYQIRDPWSMGDHKQDRVTVYLWSFGWMGWVTRIRWIAFVVECNINLTSIYMFYWW